MLQFNDLLDTDTALDPKNYTIINRGSRVGIENIAFTHMNTAIQITTSTELIGNILIELSANLKDDAGNTLTEATRMRLHAAESPSNLLYLDFGASNTVTNASDVWNQVAMNTSIRNAVGNGTGTPAELISDLLDANGLPTGITLTMTDTLGGTNDNGTQSGPYPIGATSDTLFGHANTWNGFTDNNQGIFVLSNLDSNHSYDFTFYASRNSVGDNRETEYTLTGAASQSVTLNPANNISDTVQITDVQPNASGEITLRIRAGAQNTNADGFYYIGAMVIDNNSSSLSPKLHPPVCLGSDMIIDWTGSGQLWTSDHLGDWTPVTPTPTPPYEDPISVTGHRFYKIEY